MNSYLAQSSDDYAVFRARFAMDVYRALVLGFHERESAGLTKQDLANILGVHKSVISRRLSGASNLTLSVISDMARAMGYRPEIQLARYEDLAGNNSAWVILDRAQSSDKSSSQPPRYSRVDKSDSPTQPVRVAV